MRVRFAYRSRFPKQIERFIPRAPVAQPKEKPAPRAAAFICPRCFADFDTAEKRKAHRPACAMDRLAAKAAKIEPRLAGMNPAQRERVVAGVRKQFDRLSLL